MPFTSTDFALDPHVFTALTGERPVERGGKTKWQFERALCMLPVEINNVDSESILALIRNGVGENRHLEYKRSLILEKDSQKKEFLADITSFANQDGGDIVIGVEEKNGVPQTAIGVERHLVDGLVLQLESLIRDAVAPALHVQTKVVGDFALGPCLLIRISPSWMSPHMVTYKGTNKFFARGGGGKYLMDVTDLRNAFLESGRNMELIRKWRDSRVESIASRDAPIAVPAAPGFVLLLLPLDSDRLPYRIETTSFLSSEVRSKLRTIDTGGWKNRINLDGFLSYQDQGEYIGYCQAYRSGRVEAVQYGICSVNADGSRYIASEWYERAIIESTSSYLAAIRSLGVASPVVFMLSLINVSGCRMAVDRVTDHWSRDRNVIDRNVVRLPEIVLQNVPDDLPAALRPAFDASWNASGFPRSLNYGSDGKWAKGNLAGVAYHPSDSV